MSKHRYAAKVDKNQPAIVEALRRINGVAVQVGMDDILVGYKGKNYWFEIKEPETVSKVTGVVMPSKIKPSQHKLLEHWTGMYAIITSTEEAMLIMEIENGK